MSQGSHDPYRYAGKKWWEEQYPLAAIDRNGNLPPGDAGIEKYFSWQYKRDGEHLELSEQTTSLPSRETVTEELGPTSYDYLRMGGPHAVLYLAEVFNRWAQDMTAWAVAVREDIKRLEGHCGVPRGDPGDPPPVPWK